MREPHEWAGLAVAVTVQRPVVAVVYAELATPVVRAQSFPLLAALRERGRKVDLVAFASPRRFVSLALRRGIARAARGVQAATGRPPEVLTYRPRTTSFRGAGRRLARVLRDSQMHDALLLCRQPRATLIAAAARDELTQAGRSAPRVILDLRGLRDVEYLHSLEKSEEQLDPAEAAALAGYRDREAAACRAADGIVCVSRGMMTELRRRHPDLAAPVAHVPNHAESVSDPEELRRAARARLRVADDAVLIAYLGGMSAWQMAEESALLVRALAEAQPGLRALFLTHEADAARAILKRVDATDVLVRSAPSGDAHLTLAAADYGLLLRRNDPVNRVACPVKFGEYLACGVRPVLTPNVGDQSDLVMGSDLGLVVGLADVGAAVRKIIVDAARPGTIDLDGREKRRAWARENISATRAAERLTELLEQLE